MSAKQSALATTQAIATIVATVATPLLVAYFGWRIQMDSTSEGIKKDYVQMSIAILKDGTKDEQLRRWAVSVVDANSPIKFNPSLRVGLEEGKIDFIPMKYPMPPAELMEAPYRWKTINKDDVKVGDLFENYTENREIAAENSIRLWYLQQVIKGYSDISEGREPEPLKKPPNYFSGKQLDDADSPGQSSHK